MIDNVKSDQRNTAAKGDAGGYELAIALIAIVAEIIISQLM